MAKSHGMIKAKCDKFKVLPLKVSRIKGGSIVARQRMPARYKKGLVLTKDNKLVRLHGNMTPTSYKIVNYFLWKAVKEGRLENLEVNVTELSLIHI